MHYPIIEQVQLPEVRRGLFRRNRRDVSQLPRQRPGTVLVFHAHNQYLVAPSQRLHGDEPVVVDAASVTVVDVRQRMVPVHLDLRSANPANAFALRVTFGCRVREAASVVATHADLMEELTAYLRQDRQLRALASSFTHDELADAQDALSAQIEARFSLKPLDLEGIDISLSDVDVLTPEDMAVFERERQDVIRRQILEKLHRDFDRAEADLIERILDRGPRAVEALAIRLGEVNMANATARSYGEADKATSRLLEMFTNLATYGHADQVPVDTAAVIDEIVMRITGKQHSVTSQPTSVSAGEPAASLESGQVSRHSVSSDVDDEGEWRGSPKPQEVDDDL